jgi:hypothetical protein
MKRRNLLLGLGAAVSGGAATMGTGAFSSAQANRSVSVNVASDNPGAYLALDETNLPNGGAAVVDNGEIEIDLNGFPSQGVGLGPATNATTDIDGVFEVINQGTQNLFVNIGSLSLDSGNTTVTFYPGESQSTDLSDGSADLKLPTGKSAPIGLRVVTDSGTDTSTADNADTTVTATNSSDDPTTLQTSNLDLPEQS